MKKKSKQSGKNTSKSKVQKELELEEALDKAIKAPKKEAKVRVNTWIDSDIYLALNKEAKATGTKYQTLLNKYLRAAVLKEINIGDLKALVIAIRENQDKKSAS
jgi:uncharacterized protein (DUF4415 family)